MAATTAPAAGAVARGAGDCWDLGDVFPDEQTWAEALRDVETRLSSLEVCRGRLSDGPARLADCLDAYVEAVKWMRRVGSYASMRYDEDTRASREAEMQQRAGLVATRLNQAASFLRPEILSLGRATVDRWLEEEPRLRVYAHWLDDLLRRAAHTLSPAEERIVAAAGLVTDAPYTTYSMLANADIRWPTVVLSDGQEVRLDQSGYAKHRADPHRADREKVFAVFWGTWAEYARTFGALLFAQLKRDLFYAQVRNYPTTLAAALDEDHIPESVYRTLVDEANANLGALHRYFVLRGRLLGVEEMRYHDIYPPLVKTAREFPLEVGKRLIVESVQPLGQEYAAVMARSLGRRWMDVYPRAGKRAGAYMNGSVYDVHPFVLMNYVDDYESVSTMAHEWGHALHAHLSNTHQPFIDSDYPIFLAEVASTFNEALLLDRMLREADGDDDRLFFLGSELEQLRGTFFRQAMFAEFELRIHEAVEQGEALSGDAFSGLYGDILRRYHGHDEGVVRIDPAYAVEWAFIPHFYYDFYVYQYATSLAASSLLVERVRKGEPGAVDAYLDLLKAGGGEYAYDLLRRAGVDLATPAPYRALVRRMARIMDEIEEILARRC